MFYAHIVLAKKGPFARIWLAAHWDKKLTKAQVFETNIEQSVEGIMQPKVKLALRTSGHLLLGVVRIYSRKAKYLLADCNEAFVKIKMAFRPGMVDLPEEHREAAVNAITLPEVFHDFDTALPELNDVDIEAQFSINQSRADEITMREDYGSIPMSIHDEGFGDMALDDADFIRDDPNIDENLLDENHDELTVKEPRAGTSRSLLDLEHGLGDNDGFGDGDGFGEPAAGLFEGDMFADAPLEPTPAPIDDTVADADSDDDMDGGGWHAGPPSTAPSSPIEFMPSSPPKGNAADRADASDASLMPPFLSTEGVNDDHPSDENDPNVLNQQQKKGETADGDENDDAPDQTTLLNNEEESFALAPVDASALKGVTKAKRKRKLIVDEVKNISGEEMKSQLANTSDIITTLDLAPPTKRLMYWKDTGGVEKMFTLCSRDIKARVLFKNNQRHFQSRSFGLDDFTQLGPSDVLALDQYQQENEPITAVRRGRKRKNPVADATEMLPPPVPGGAHEAVRDGSAVMAEAHSVASVAEDQSALSVALGPDYISSPNPHMLASPNAEPLSQLSPNALSIGNQTPHGDFHDDMSGGGFMDGASPMHGGGMTPGYSADYGGAADIQSPAFTPSYAGGVTPHHNMMDHLDTIPNLPADQVSSILNGTGMENIGFGGMGFDDQQPIVATSKVSDRVASEWNDEDDFPPEVGSHQPGDEQLENETDEQFEERVLNKRAAQMFVSVRSRMTKVDHMYLSEMTQKNNRKQAAQKFYSLLVLKKFQALDIRQDTSYGDILVTKGIMFDNPKL